MISENIENIYKNIEKQKQILSEINLYYSSLAKSRTDSEKNMLNSQIKSLGKSFEIQAIENLNNLAISYRVLFS